MSAPGEILQLTVSGRVQGVYFRAFTRQAALEIGVRGWVRNLPDGNVEVQAAGTPEQLAALKARVAAGPPGASVTAVEEQPLERQVDWTTFEVVYWPDAP